MFGFCLFHSLMRPWRVCCCLPVLGCHMIILTGPEDPPGLVVELPPVHATVMRAEATTSPNQLRLTLHLRLYAVAPLAPMRLAPLGSRDRRASRPTLGHQRGRSQGKGGRPPEDPGRCTSASMLGPQVGRSTPRYPAR